MYNLSLNNAALQFAALMLHVLPPARATNFRVAESRRRIYFLQHENLFCMRVGDNTRNKQSHKILLVDVRGEYIHGYSHLTAL